jgi:type II secretory pathway pseudopilin PulG
LVELMVVILIIGILAGLLFSISHGIFARGDRSRATAELQAISVALESYRLRFGDYPDLVGSGQLFQALDGKLGPKGNTLDPAFPPFLESGIFSIDDVGSPELLDPWMQPYQYLYLPIDGSRVQSGYLLFSSGPDKNSSKTGDTSALEDKDNIWPGD